MAERLVQHDAVHVQELRIGLAEPQVVLAVIPVVPFPHADDERRQFAVDLRDLQHVRVFFKQLQPFERHGGKNFHVLLVHPQDKVVIFFLSVSEYKVLLIHRSLLHMFGIDCVSIIAQESARRYRLFVLRQMPRVSASLISSSRKSGCAREMMSSALSHVVLPTRFTRPYSVTR